MKLAVIADIHGNALALEAVLADLASHTVDQLVQLGDAFNGPIDPAGVARLLRSRPMIHIQGNGERMVVAEDPAHRSRSAAFARERLDNHDLEWIKTWPDVFEHPDFFACHGTPSSDEAYLLELPLAEGSRLSLREEVAKVIAAVRRDLVLCAHSHVPRVVQAGSRVLVVNPGSVGLPAYRLAAPFPHAMETGSPAARYARVEKVEFGWKVVHVAVPYDHERAASIAEREGFSEWAAQVRTGYAG